MNASSSPTDFSAWIGRTQEADDVLSRNLIQRIAEASERPVSFTLMEIPFHPEVWREYVAGIDAMQASGLVQQVDDRSCHGIVLLGSPYWDSLVGMVLVGWFLGLGARASYIPRRALRHEPPRSRTQNRE